MYYAPANALVELRGIYRDGQNYACNSKLLDWRGGLRGWDFGFWRFGRAGMSVLLGMSRRPRRILRPVADEGQRDRRDVGHILLLHGERLRPVVRRRVMLRDGQYDRGWRHADAGGFGGVQWQRHDGYVDRLLRHDRPVVLFAPPLHSVDAHEWSPAATVNTGPLTANTAYLAQVGNGACAVVNSTTPWVTVDSPSVGGTATAAASTVCSGGSTTVSVSGNTPNTWYGWYSSPDDASWVYTGTANAPLNTGPLTASTYFLCVSVNGSCAVSGRPPTR